ncbi:MAG: hypothetical protein KDI82_09010, partial [Gammaproteobacteria bacterium]|nr:hypothetical protein [Gammaproteobacteria bacterium]
MLRRFTTSDALLRLTLCVLAAVAMWGVTTAWKPPFAFRRGFIPPRDIVARVEFSRPDPEQYEALKLRRRGETICVYTHNVRPLIELREALTNRVFELLAAETWMDLDLSVWEEFQPEGKPRDPAREEQEFFALRAALAGDMELRKFQEALVNAFKPFETDGLLDSLHALEDGSQTAILVHPVGDEDFLHRVNVGQVQVAEAQAALGKRLDEAFKEAYGESVDSSLLATYGRTWLNRHRLQTTLKINEDASEAARQKAIESIPMPTKAYKPGDLLARSGSPLQEADLALLHLEYDAEVAQRSWGQIIRYTIADLGMFGALYVLCGAYLLYHTPQVLRDKHRFTTLLGLVVLTGALYVLCGAYLLYHTPDRKSVG